MAIDLKKVRVETPGVKSVNHLLACGSALVPQPVQCIAPFEIDAVVGAMHCALRWSWFLGVSCRGVLGQVRSGYIKINGYM